jgi:hypothetical protein
MVCARMTAGVVGVMGPMGAAGPAAPSSLNGVRAVDYRGSGRPGIADRTQVSWCPTQPQTSWPLLPLCADRFGLGWWRSSPRCPCRAWLPETTSRRLGRQRLGLAPWRGTVVGRYRADRRIVAAAALAITLALIASSTVMIRSFSYGMRML